MPSVLYTPPSVRSQWPYIDPRDSGARTAAADNTAAFQAADAKAVISGNTVLVPAGVWACTAALGVLKGKWMGEGWLSIIKCNTALAAGTPFIVIPSTANGAIYPQGYEALANLQVSGPIAGLTIGVNGTTTEGVRQDIGCVLRSVFITGFHYGVGWNATTGHCSLIDSVVQLCDYNVYDIADNGDNRIIGTILTSANWASLAMSGNKTGVFGAGNAIQGEFIKVHFGAAPYGIYQETAVTTRAVFLDSCRFIDCAWETIGNAGIYSEQAAGATVNTTEAAMLNCQFERVAFTWNEGSPPAYKIAARDRNYAVVIGNFVGYNSIRNAATGFYTATAAPAGVNTISAKAVSGSLEYWEASGIVATAPSTFAISGSPGAENIIYHPPWASDAEYGSITIPTGTASQSVTVHNTLYWVGPLASLQLTATLDDNASWTPTSYTLLARIASSIPGNGFTQIDFFVTFAPTPVPAGQSFVIRWRLR